MAFNPLKNRKIVQPDLEEQNNSSVNTKDIVNDELLSYDSSPTTMVEEKPMLFENTKVADLQEVGLETISLLKVASKTAVHKQNFNLNVLKTLPLSLVFEHFNGVKTDDFTYQVLNHKIIINQAGNKWFNTTIIPKKGSENAINLAKHLIAIKENINEIDNDKSLFVAAGRLLNTIHNNLNYQPEEVSNEIQDNTSFTPIIHESVDNSTEANNEVVPGTTGISENVETAKPLTYEEKKVLWAKQKEKDKLVNEELKEIPLEEVFDYMGANGNEDGDSNKWKTDNGHNIGAKGQAWQNYSTLSKGYGAITLLADYIAERDNINVRDDKARTAVWYQARTELLAQFGKDLEADAYKGYLGKKIFNEPFYMPHVLDHKLDDMREYLHEKRGIPKWLIEKQIKENTLFAGAPSSWTIPFLNQPEKMSNEYVWAVFMSPNHEAAELRGIAREDKDAKIKPKGNVTDCGGFRIKPEKDCKEFIVMAVEAAIDTLSYAALYPGRGVASCMGVNYKLAVMSALQTFEQPKWKYEISLDNDQAGYEATLKFREELIHNLGQIDEDDEDTTVDENKGEKQHKLLFDTGRLKYFSLGIQCALECFATNKVFYLDVSNNEIGRDVATLFQEQLSKVIPMNEIRGYIKQGLIKYANICPVWERTKDPEEAAKLAFELLSSNKPYYYRAKSIKEESEDMTPKKEQEIKLLTERKEIFEETFKKLAGDQYQQWVAEGKIIFKKESIAKDWNDYLNYSKNKPEVAATLAANEAKYSEIYKKANATKAVQKMKLK